MPFAPQTINIRYGDPSSLLALAGQAGQAEGRMNDYRTQYNGYLQRLGADQSFLENEANRRQSDSHFQTQIALRQSEDAVRQDENAHASDLQDAHNQALLALKSKEIDARQRAQKGVSARSAATKPLDLVDAEGNPYAAPQPQGYGVIQNTDTGEVTEDRGGQISDYNAEGNILQGPGATERLSAADANAGVQGPNQPPMTRQQFMQKQRLDATRENLDTRETNINARQDKSIANRAAVQSPVARIGANNAAQAETHATMFDAVVSKGDPTEVVSVANGLDHTAFFNPEKPVDVAKATAVVRAHASALHTQAAALQQPVTNSNGASLTGGNVVKVQTPADAARLPSGTVYMAPDGILRRIP